GKVYGSIGTLISFGWILWRDKRHSSNKVLTLSLKRLTPSFGVSNRMNKASLNSQTNMRAAFKGNIDHKGLAYTREERSKLGILGLLPAAEQSQDRQVEAVMNFIENSGSDDLNKYIYLRNLKDYNERLFYKTVTQNVEKLMPIVYTPVVGLACHKFSQIFTRPRGLFITINDIDNIPEILSNWHEPDVKVIVVTDGERILGLGDLGANGMGIPIGKLSLYTALAGIPPSTVLPVHIDVGTNNEEFLNDPFYIGLRQRRVRGDKYLELLDKFVQAVTQRFGRSCLIQFEDFGNSTAFDILLRYQKQYCVFNDDIQGTASVCLSGLISAAKLTNTRITESIYLFYGAGEANIGTANLIVMAMTEQGLKPEEARKKIWMVDSKGLIVKNRSGAPVTGHKQAFAQDAPEIKDLEAIVEFVKPTALIGASAQGGSFTEKICEKMSSFNERPIIFALSNPTSKAECTAEQAYKWTNGKCVFASGSPFDPVTFGGRTYITGQGNNAYIFPGVGLAVIAAQVYTIPEETFLVSAKALSDQVTEHDFSIGLVYPRLSRVRDVTNKVAARVLEYLYAERLANYRPEPSDKLAYLKSLQYDPDYDSISPSLTKLSLDGVSQKNRFPVKNGSLFSCH
ncbi:NADP-dependent malic enzyme, mitochondrial, partial [Fragariocoptes setiger]